MKKHYLCLIIGWFLIQNVFCQEAKINIYNPSIDAAAELTKAIQKAKAEHKNVLIQIGGNWCPWCIRLHKFFETNIKADSLIKEGYVFLLINYSKENKNLHLLKKLDYPQRFGFPVLVVLNNKGVRIHTQDTGLLEEGSGYDEKKVIGFLKNWTIMALDDKLYNK